MAVPQGRRPGPGGLARFALWACAGIAAFNVFALFTAHGQAHDFAEGALAVGVGGALAAALIKQLARLPWGDIIGLAALASLWDDLMAGRRR
jgi:hypothetical protein